MNRRNFLKVAAAGSNNELTMRALSKFYSTLSGYMRWQDRGSVLAAGCPTRDAVLKTDFPAKAYELGLNL